MRISVALCTFNGEEYLENQLTSILNQTCPVDEIIICDDNSTDNTISIVNSYIEEGIENIILIQNKENIGTIKNFEKAIDKCTGDIIFLSDQDDIWHLNKVEVMISFFLKKSNALLLFTDGNLIDSDNNLLESTLWDEWNFSKEMQKRWNNNQWAFNDLFINNNKVTGATIAFRAELKKLVLPIEVPVGYWHDAWVALHAAANDGLFYLNTALIDYRLHPKQQIGITAKPLSKVSHEFISEEIFHKNIMNLYPTLFLKNRIYKKVINKLKAICKLR